jgi:hypothetical protein
MCCSFIFTSGSVVFAGVNKKDLYPRRNTHWIKVLLAMVIVPGPSLATVLTNTESAMSPADSYSPLLKV